MFHCINTPHFLSLCPCLLFSVFTLKLWGLVCACQTPVACRGAVLSAQPTSLGTWGSLLMNCRDPCIVSCLGAHSQGTALGPIRRGLIFKTFSYKSNSLQKNKYKISNSQKKILGTYNDKSFICFL